MHLQVEVVVEAARGVVLDDEGEGAFVGLLALGLRFRRTREIALPVVFLEHPFHYSGGEAVAAKDGCYNSGRRRRRKT